MSELDTELKGQGISLDTDMPKLHMVIIVSKDGAYIDNQFVSASSLNAAHITSTAEVTPQEIAKIGEILLPAYESGDIIALYFPTASSINAMYEALGEQPFHFEGLTEGSADTYPEIYAMAKRYGVNATHYFSYTVPGSKALLAHSILEDIMSGDGKFTPEDGQDDTSNLLHNVYDTDLRQEYLFQAKRYAAFIKWGATLDKSTAELDAQAVAHVQLWFRPLPVNQATSYP